MKRNGIARCGLACCLCENVLQVYSGCRIKTGVKTEMSISKKIGIVMSAEKCRKGLLGKIKPYALLSLPEGMGRYF